MEHWGGLLNKKELFTCFRLNPQMRVLAIHLSIKSLETRSGLEPIARCDPSGYQPYDRRLTAAPSRPVRIFDHKTLAIVLTFCAKSTGISGRSP